jgi:uncharacterized DUF497 family protein
MRITDFEWDQGNILHIALGHGIEPEEAEEAFVVAPLFRRTKRGHYAVFGPARSGRLLVVVFEHKPGGHVRVITGWDMATAERRYWQRHRRTGR